MKQKDGDSMVWYYLHGFASSPHSTKASYLHDRFAALHTDLRVPDLNQGGFPELTITRQIHQVAAELPKDAPVTLIGSSLGGLVAAWVGQQQLQVQRLILLAPAFQFLSHWLAQLGAEQIKCWQKERYLTIYHHGEKRSLPLSYEFILDAAQYRDSALLRPIPTLILHGQYDEVIPLQASQDFASSRPWVKLISLLSNHALGNVLPQIWQEIQTFCQSDLTSLL